MDLVFLVVLIKNHSFRTARVSQANFALSLQEQGIFIILLGLNFVLSLPIQILGRFAATC